MAFDPSLARGQFPALSGEWTFMDNAGGTQVPFQVAEAVRDYLLHSNVQLGGSYEISQKAGNTVAQARQILADLIGAKSNEIVLGANMSSLFRMLALVLSEIWEEGDEIIVSQAEHEANIGCWEYLSQFGIELKVWEMDPESFTFDVSTLFEMITDKTRLIAVHHTSNVLGNVMPIEEVSRLTKASDIYLCVDGGQYVPHRLVDVKQLDADFYIFSTYKAFGPHLGVMYGKREVLEAIPRWSHFFYDDTMVPGKFELGCLNYEGIAGILGVEKYFRALGMSLNEPFRDVVTKVYASFKDHEVNLAKELIGYLASKPRVQVVGSTNTSMVEDRLPIVSFMVSESDPQEIVMEVDKAKVGIRWGHFNAPRLLDSMGYLEYKGVIRASLAHYNTVDEIERLQKALDPLVS